MAGRSFAYFNHHWRRKLGTDWILQFRCRICHLWKYVHDYPHYLCGCRHCGHLFSRTFLEIKNRRIEANVCSCSHGGRPPGVSRPAHSVAVRCPLPVGCPPVQARQPPSGRIAQKKGLETVLFKSLFTCLYKEIMISSLNSSGRCSASTEILITKLMLNLEEISFNLERTNPIYSSDTEEMVKKLSRYIASKSWS